MNAEVLLGDRSAAGGAAASCGYPITGIPIRVRVASGGAPSSPIAPGDRVALAVGTAATGLAKRTLWLDLAFEYQAANGTWKAIGGFQRSVHTLYTLVGTSKLSVVGNVSSDAKEMPFVAAVDEVTSWVSPATPVTTAVGALEVVTRAVNQKKGLVYDDYAGAARYADGMDVSTQLAFSEFLSGKARGSIVNCSDCSAIVSVYGRSVGADSESLILGWDFPLNYIRGIGFADFKADVFNTGYPGFSYHAVTSRNQGATIHDACLEVDDGPNPGSAWASRTPRLPVDMDYARYQQKLTPGWYSIQARGRPVQN